MPSLSSEQDTFSVKPVDDVAWIKLFFCFLLVLEAASICNSLGKFLWSNYSEKLSQVFDSLRWILRIKKTPHKHNIWQLNGAEESKISKLSNSGVVKYILLLITCISRHKPLKFQQKLPHRGIHRYFSSTFLCSISLIMFFTPKKVKDGADCICVAEAVERLVGKGLAVHCARVCF